MKIIFSFIFFLAVAQFSSAQELLATVNINSQQLPGSNQQTYKTLERNVRDFINNTSWTGKSLDNFEKIKCNFSMILTGKDGNRYNGSIVVQSVRPVFNSTYESPILNIAELQIETQLQ